MHDDPGPRERLLRLGATKLSDAELVSIVLGTGSPGCNVHVFATKLLHDLGGLRGLTMAGARRLARLQGLGPAKSARLIAAIELGVRCSSLPETNTTTLRSSDDAIAALAPRFRHAPVESFVALMVDSKNRPIAERVIALGGLSHCPVDPSQVFRAVLQESASGVLFAHNHPSGDPTPSSDDHALTQRLVEGARLLGVRVLDHVIVGHGSHYSFADAGVLNSG